MQMRRKRCVCVQGRMLRCGAEMKNASEDEDGKWEGKSDVQRETGRRDAMLESRDEWNI